MVTRCLSSILVLMLTFVLPSLCWASGELLLVDQGQANAQIIVPKDAPRLAALAARELQEHLKKISGAELPIVHEPTDDHPVHIHVGQSAHTDKLGVSNNDLKYEAYRMVSGDNWLVLIGQDWDFQLDEYSPTSNGDVPRAQEAWEKRTGGNWINPRATYTGTVKAYNKNVNFWRHDIGGSLNAVYGFLRTLGVRWYMPGDMGLILPEMKTIRISPINKTVHPDFPLRYSQYWYGFSGAHAEEVLWQRRLGLNSAGYVLGKGMTVHGIRNLQGHPEMKKNHPEYYALVNGVRDTDFRGTGHACFSSPGFRAEAVKYARAIFDVFDEPVVDLWPQDGYRQCQCELCEGKSPSDLVFAFIDHVAREVYKSHPDKFISCGAYTPYRLPPESITKFSPNVIISITHPRNSLNDKEVWEGYTSLVNAWLERLGPNRIIRSSNNRAQHIYPRKMAKDFRFLKGISLGDMSEILRANPGQRMPKPAHDHLTLYVNASCLWDADLDIDALLNEYFTLYYGPAAAEMKTAIAFIEQAYFRAPIMNKKQLIMRQGGGWIDIHDNIRFVQMLHDARKTAGDTIYGQRIERFIQEAPTMEALLAQKKKAEQGGERKDAPLAIGHDADSGKTPETYTLRHIRTGDAIEPATTFTVTWDRDAIIFDILCHEPDMANLAISSDVWGGDSVAILLETNEHSYYQIEINPDGQIYNADRGGVETLGNWNSLAEVTTEKTTDRWRVKVRIPVAAAKDGADSDPFNRVVGSKPSATTPWYFNLGRTRVRSGEMESSTFNPTLMGGYHKIERFGRLEIR